MKPKEFYLDMTHTSYASKLPDQPCKNSLSINYLNVIEKSAFDKIVIELKKTMNYYESCGDCDESEVQIYQSHKKLLKELGQIE
jgi:hypothetical protein